MELPKQLVGFARRAAAELPTGTFDSIIRSVGEAKSIGDEAALVKRMVAIVKEGLTHSSLTPKAQRDLLLYLVYIDMLGHDTGWAHASIISMCSSKNLLVKKVAYLSASLLIDPASDLTIMVTATIQSDLKSDNFLVVCAAQAAVSRFVTAELVSVFLPQTVALLQHERDVVKKKSLLMLHRFLQLDPGLAPDIERHFIEKLGYKEPAVMVAALCGLQQLISANPRGFLNLVPYLTSILKQAGEGKLGRAYDYHRAPAPFVQIYLLRLLSLLGAADPACSDNMCPVISEVWRRAETLGNNIGNALVYECLRTAAAMQSSGASPFTRQTLASITRLLSSRDNNLKYAAIDVLSRLVTDDVAAAQQHQYAVVECLRSADSTLKRKTLDLLYAMAGPGNIEVVAAEALAYIKDAEDEGARAAAAATLCDLAERFGPDQAWFVDVVNQVLLVAGDSLPGGIADHLIALFAEDTGVGNDALLKKYVDTYLELLDRPKLPAILLKVICWMVGEHGGLARGGVSAAQDVLAAVPEVQSPSDEVLAHLLAALGKLGVKGFGNLTPDAARFVEAMAHSEAALLQQQAVEVLQLLRSSHDVQAAAFSRSAFTAPAIDASLPFLDAFEAQALAAGAAPHLDLRDRVAMGMSTAPTTHRVPRQRSSTLKFSAYAKGVQPEASPPAAQPSGALDMADFDFSNASGGGGGGLTGPQPSAGQPASPAPAPAPKLVVKRDRKWGPAAAQSPQPAPSPVSAAATGAPIAEFTGAGWHVQQPGRSTRREEPPAARDPEKEQLAASLFGGAARSPGGAGGGGWRSGQSAKPKAEAPNFLGDLMDSGEEAAPRGNAPAAAAPRSVMDLLGDLDAPSGGGQSSTGGGAGLDDMFSFMGGAGQGQAAAPPIMLNTTLPGNPQPAPSQKQAKSTDPFASLLD